MTYLFFIFALFLSAAGLYFLYDFLSWRFKSQITFGTILKFSEAKDKGLPLPIVEFEDRTGAVFKGATYQIDRLLYILNRPLEGSVITISYQVDNPEYIRVHGYIPCILAGLLNIPLVAAIGFMIGSAVIASKAGFLLLFLGFLVGGWILLKLIQRSD